MSRRMIWMLIIVGVILGCVFGWKAFVNGKIKEFMAGMANPPQTVSTTTAGYQDWRSQLTAVGSLRAARGVDIANEIAGIVDEIHFDSGDDVKAGTLLIKLRDDDDVAKLRTLEAAGKLADINYGRDVKQFKAQAIAQATVDTDMQTLAGAQAQVAEQQAVVDKKLIKAPFSGHLGIRNVDLGEYIKEGTAIVTVQDLDHLYLDFFLPQQALSQIKLGQQVVVKNDTYPDKTFSAVIKAINPRVDTATRNVQVRAQMDNPGHLLLPGMYATAAIETGAPQHAITLPQTAITYNPYGNTVYLVEEKKDENGKPVMVPNADPKSTEAAKPQLVAHQTFVTIGDTRGDQVTVVKGVKEGDVVVTSGQIKLQNGSPVMVNNTVSPSNDPNPAPHEQ